MKTRKWKTEREPGPEEVNSSIFNLLFSIFYFLFSIFNSRSFSLVLGRRPMRNRTSRSAVTGFTLVELMVVILIILLVSAVVLPTVLPALQHRQVTEAGRILQAGLVQARATAVQFNAPRGIRLLPDPTYASSPTILAYNRWVPIEPGPDYSNGQVVVWPLLTALEWANNNNLPVPPQIAYPGGSGAVYPYLSQAFRSQFYGGFQPQGEVLLVEQAPFVGNNAGNNVVPPVLNNPTSWFWNIRVGDTIQIGDQGRKYTIIGPCTISPFSPVGSATYGNPEMFVNDGPPGNTPLFGRFYTDNFGNQNPNAPFPVEYLLVVNGQDDDSDGFIDNGWDGFDNNYTGTFDEAVTQYNGNPVTEWTEVEQWLGAERGRVGAFSYTGALLNSTTGLPAPANYTINRRPVVSPGARETSLPANVVIDATSWNSTAERSRLPIDRNSRFVDILLNPNGQTVLQTTYSNPTSVGENATFYHFWLSERADVHEFTDVWGINNGTNPPTPNPNPNAPASIFHLPIPASFTGGLNTPPTLFLTGERMLVTLFGRTGQITTNSVEFFNANDVNQPFYDSQLGAREAK